MRRASVWPSDGRILTAVIGLFLQNCVCSSNTVTQVECYSCSSAVDQLCVSSPSQTTVCSTTHGRGCATRLLLDGGLERGCAESVGLSPEGCQVSRIFDTECVCHTKKCNRGIPIKLSQEQSLNRTASGQRISCYECSSQTDPGCQYTLPDSSEPRRLCPVSSGCFLMKSVDGGGILNYHRLCYEDGPATYYPAGCYTVFNEYTSSTTEVCVCYESGCNRDSQTALLSAHKTKEGKTPDKASAVVDNSKGAASSSKKQAPFIIGVSLFLLCGCHRLRL